MPYRSILLGGVCGSGMIGLARMGLQCGFEMKGCDRYESGAVAELKAGGLVTFNENQIECQSKVDLVVCSSALGKEHPLRKWADGQSIPVWSRARFLSYLLRDRQSILVTGTHGKTTTAVLLTHALKKSGRDCSFYIGAEVPLLGTSAYLGTDTLAVVEADESDGSFDAFVPAHVLVLNIEEDHLDYYGGLDDIVNAFQGVIDKCSGQVVACAEDPHISAKLRKTEKFATYGFCEGADYQGQSWADTSTGGTELAFETPDGEMRRIELGLKGRHNALNVLGVAALLDKLGFAEAVSEEVFRGVSGARRRFEIRGESNWGRIIDDYAHHPTEIRATLETARKEAQGRLICVFQPHRFSRTLKLLKRFGEAFSPADKVYLAPVYGAGEAGESGEVLELLRAELARHHADVACKSSLKDILRDLRRDWNRGDHVCFLGAGDITESAGVMGEEVGQIGELEEIVGDSGTCRLYEPLARHTTLRVGGPADAWVEVSSVEALKKIIYYAKTRTKEYRVIGRGTNLLVRDGGIRGICVHLKGGDFDALEIDGKVVRAGAGVRLKKIVQEARKAGLGGLEFMEGIPGNLGGALCMNAGAMQSWMFEVTSAVTVLCPDGEVKDVPREEIKAGYRNVPIFNDHIALGAELVGQPATVEEIGKRLKTYSEKRWSSQPAKPSAGCSFKNPGEIPAGRLIEELNLKGRKVGGAQVSTVHGNFIVNDSHASAKDVLDLIAMIKEEAERKRGIHLEPEVIILGED